MRLNPVTRIDIELGPSQIAVREPDGPPLVFEPVVYLAPGKPRGRAVAVGTAPEAGTGATRVDLFGEAHPPTGVTFDRCFDLFFGHVLYQMVGRPLFRTKPEVVVRLTAPAADRLGTEGCARIHDSLERYGARSVRWETGNDPDRTWPIPDRPPARMGRRAVVTAAVFGFTLLGMLAGGVGIFLVMELIGIDGARVLGVGALIGGLVGMSVGRIVGSTMTAWLFGMRELDVERIVSR